MPPELAGRSTLLTPLILRLVLELGKGFELLGRCF